jgi:uncharacterized membrane protein
MRGQWMSVIAMYLHLLGMATYVGGSLVMEFVVGPAQKAIPPAQQQVMGEKTADRFLMVVWASLGLLLLSGILQTFPAHREKLLVGDGLFDSSYGRTLFVMIVLWVVLVVNGAIITFVLRPKLKGKLTAQVGAAQVQSRQQEMIQAASRITLITRIDLVIAVLLPLVGAGLIQREGIF